MECVSCLIALPADARFCGSCGTPVSQRTDEPADPLREVLKVALGRQYEVLRLLGRGGMGAVYLARETSLDREVAIKVLTMELRATEENRERFRREARTAAKLSHPNIVPLHTFGEVEGTLYFVMGYVRGESLAEKLRREGRLDVDTSRRILVELTHALEYAHGIGVVHRDIKPDNVLIDEGTGRAVLTDFGIAKPLAAGETLTVKGSLLGTPQYMSPEQAAGRSDIDHRSDLYSLGILGYALLAGRLPFEGKTTGDVLVQHISAEPPPLKTLASHVPVELSLALTRCLAKDPDRRWFDAAELRANLLPPGEDDLPRAFSDLREFAFSSIIVTLVALYVAIGFYVSNEPERAIVVFWMTGLGHVGLLSIAFVIWRSLRKVGYESRRILRETLLQPKRWIGWYPRRFRVHGDVYDRLPADLRRVRASLTAWIIGWMAVCLPLVLVSLIGDDGKDPEAERVEIAILVVLVATGVLPLMTGAFFQLRWRLRAKAAGFYDAEIEGLLTTLSTAPSTFWSKPAVARILTPLAPRAERPIPTTTEEMVSGISSKVSTLLFPARELGDRAVTAARKLSTSIDAFDREISVLSETIDPTERSRLNVKLEAIAGKPEASTLDVRAMLQQQLDLVHKLESRLEEAKAERARRIELLKTLWLHVLSLAATEGTVPTSDTRQKVRALCDEIGIYTDLSTVAGTSQEDQPTIAR